MDVKGQDEVQGGLLMGCMLLYYDLTLCIFYILNLVFHHVSNCLNGESGYAYNYINKSKVAGLAGLRFTLRAKLHVN